MFNNTNNGNHSIRYLSNFPLNQYELVEEAIRVSGRTDIHIDDDPMPMTSRCTNLCGDNGYSSPEHLFGTHFSIYLDVYDNQYTDTNGFWKEFTRLVNSIEWITYIKLRYS